MKRPWPERARRASFARTAPVGVHQSPELNGDRQAYTDFQQSLSRRDTKAPTDPWRGLICEISAHTEEWTPASGRQP